MRYSQHHEQKQNIGRVDQLHVRTNFVSCDVDDAPNKTSKDHRVDGYACQGETLLDIVLLYLDKGEEVEREGNEDNNQKTGLPCERVPIATFCGLKTIASDYCRHDKQIDAEKYACFQDEDSLFLLRGYLQGTHWHPSNHTDARV